MEVGRQSQSPNFKALITTNEAKTLLREGDELIRKTTGMFPSMYIQPDMRKPLWSKVEQMVAKEQESNPNNILIDVIKQKTKKFIQIVTTDKSGQVETKEIVEPFAKEGTWTEIFGKSNYAHSSQNPDKKYVKSDFFDALANAEEKVNELFSQMKAALEDVQVSIRELPKEVKVEKPPYQRNKKTLAAWERKQKKKEAWEAERLERQEAREKALGQKKASIKKSEEKSEVTKKLLPQNKQRLSRKDKKAQKSQNA